MVAADGKSFTMPQFELSHAFKSGLRGGHTIPDPRLIHRPLNVLRCNQDILELREHNVHSYERDFQYAANEC